MFGCGTKEIWDAGGICELVSDFSDLTLRVLCKGRATVAIRGPAMVKIRMIRCAVPCFAVKAVKVSIRVALRSEIFLGDVACLLKLQRR